MLPKECITRRQLEHIADALGMPISDSLYVVGSKRLIGPLAGLQIPLEMKMSHATGQKDEFVLICWKVSGSLYIAIAHEPAQDIVTVVLLDKGRLSAKHNGVKLASHIARAEGKGQIKTLDDYLITVQDGLVGAWFRRAGQKDWQPVDAETV